MDKKYNSMTFSTENMEEGIHKELIDYLVNYHLNEDDHFNDIHITTDGECLVVEWVQVPYDRTYGGSFQYCDEDSYVVTEVIFPDNSSELVEPERKEEVFNEWLTEHPTWKKNQWGFWFNEEELNDLKKEDKE